MKKFNNKTGNIHKRIIEVRSCNHCCSGRALNATYAECVSVSLGIQHAKLMRIIYGLFGSTIFLYIIS